MPFGKLKMFRHVQTLVCGFAVSFDLSFLVSYPITYVYFVEQPRKDIHCVDVDCYMIYDLQQRVGKEAETLDSKLTRQIDDYKISQGHQSHWI